MTQRHVARFVESLLARRRPRGFRARPEDIEVVRTAVILQGANPDLAAPRDAFVSDLFDELAAARPQTGPATPPIWGMRRRVAAVSVAAAAVLIAGTAAVTEAVDRPAPVRAASGQLSPGVRTVQLVDAGHRGVGEINLYRGQPSWVFMDLKGTWYDGPVTCELMAADGSILMRGTFSVTNGSGEWARTLVVGTGRIAQARIVTSAGATLASATFA
jgi:hypothetical protein